MKWFIQAPLLITLLYVLLAVGGKYFHPTREIFPIFHWSLFTEVPNQAEELQIYTTMDGNRNSIFKNRKYIKIPYVNAHIQTRVWKKSFLSGDFEKALKVQQDLYQKVFNVKTGYELQIAKFEPRNSYLTGQLLDSLSLGYYQEDHLDWKKSTAFHFDSALNWQDAKKSDYQIENIRGMTNYTIVKGWCYDKKNKLAPKYVAVQYNGKPLISQTRPYFTRKGLSKKVGFYLFLPEIFEVDIKDQINLKVVY